MKCLGVADPGHGGFDSGAVGNGFRECDLVWKYATKFVAAMQRCGVTMFLTREQNKTVKNNQSAELSYRAQLANSKGVNFYVSFHDNSGGGTGFESYRGGDDSATIRLQQLIHGKVAPLFTSNGMPDRGIKKADFYVIKHTTMPAVLLELGFIDNARDAKYISNDAFQTNVSEAAAQAVCEWLGIKYVSTVAPAPKNYELYYKGVLESTFDSKDVAYKQGWEQFRSYQDAYLKHPDGAIYTFAKHPEDNPQKPVGTTIVGESQATVEQLIGYAKAVNPYFPEELPSLYLETGKKYGIKGDVSFAQMLKETGYFKFGGDVKLEQNNMAGLGATGAVAGASFVSLEEGVRAHIQHLFAYASTSPVPSGETIVDQRFNLVARGSATTWESLNGKWAVPGDGYGQEILDVHKKIMGYKQVDQTEEAIHKLASAGVIQTPDYWNGLISGKESFNADYFKILVNKMANKL